MRGMHRLMAAILLAGAVGGVVVFARHLGRVPEPALSACLRRRPSTSRPPAPSMRPCS